MEENDRPLLKTLADWITGSLSKGWLQDEDARKVFLDLGSDLALEFLRKYSASLRSHLDEREEAWLAAADEAIYANLLIRQIAEKRLSKETPESAYLSQDLVPKSSNQRLIDLANEEILEIAGNAESLCTRKIRQEMQPALHLTMLLAYESANLAEITADKELAVAKWIYSELHKFKRTEACANSGKAAVGLFCRQPVENAEKIADILKHASKNFEVQVGRGISEKKPELYEAIAGHLSPDLRNKMRYEGTNVTCATTVEFAVEDTSIIPGLIPGSFDLAYFDLELSKDGRKGRDYVFATGVEVYKLLEVDMPALIKIGWKIKKMHAGRMQDTGESANPLKRGISINKITSAAFFPDYWHTLARLIEPCAGPPYLKLRTSETTTADEVQPFAQRLKRYEREESEEDSELDREDSERSRLISEAGCRTNFRK